MCCRSQFGNRARPTPSLTQFCQTLWSPPAQGLGAEDPEIFQRMTAVISRNMETALAAYFHEMQLDEEINGAQVLQKSVEAVDTSGTKGKVKDNKLELSNVGEKRK